MRTAKRRNKGVKHFGKCQNIEPLQRVIKGYRTTSTPSKLVSFTRIDHPQWLCHVSGEGNGKSSSCENESMEEHHLPTLLPRMPPALLTWKARPHHVPSQNHGCVFQRRLNNDPRQ
jgi:hypothetical protein